ncbi:serine/threonine-protein kinase [Actinomadura macrotermitis]|uniref:serine/threonine-protein kinase n=1 Tax=Actinomadura macrotermitis TaxID=2585200 RepID=UPI001A9B27BA|nr:serine/threonine-protein kinase [Actinomadura macrotermitis]
MAEWRVAGFDEVRELGRGAQGRVVLARHAVRGTPVAIKYLAAGAPEAAREMFRREARLLGQVRDPHVARLYRLVESEQGLAIVMEAVDGVSFKEILGRYGTLEPEAALAVLKGSLRGLAAAHAAGVVHRDYKPANVIVPADGNSKLIDFGVATLDGAASRSGTPVYMAPEQWRGEPASPATDVYAATCVFYESVTGERPYTGDVRDGHLNRPVPVERVPGVLRPLVERGMAKDPAGRPAGAAAFVGELEELARGAYGADWESRGVRALAGSAVALAALFPLAAGLAPGAAAGGAGGSGVLAVLGTKAGIAVAGAAVVGATAAGGYGVYAATRPDAPRKRPAAVSSAPPAAPLVFGKFRTAGPIGWKVKRLRDWSREDKALTGSYRVDLAPTCPAAAKDRQLTDFQDKYEYTTQCAGFAVLGNDWIRPSENRSIQSYDPKYPFIPGTDPSHVCPPAPAKYHQLAVTPGSEYKRLKNELRPVGAHQAQYFEWRLVCADNQNRPAVSFVQRLWYLPDSKILIVDEWNTPGLDEILKKAAWT